MAQRGRPKKATTVTHAGTRRSEAREENPQEAPVQSTGRQYKGMDWEDPRFPGYHTVIVPRDDPRGDMHMSPIGAYEGKGYELLSEETKYTQHSGHVLMGIPIEEWTVREDARLAEHNSRFVDGYAPDLVSSNGPNDPLKFVKGKSGMKNPNHNIQTHAALQSLRKAH